MEFATLATSARLSAGGLGPGWGSAEFPGGSAMSWTGSHQAPLNPACEPEGPHLLCPHRPFWLDILPSEISNTTCCTTAARPIGVWLRDSSLDDIDDPVILC
jgi:hypothetical protein